MREMRRGVCDTEVLVLCWSCFINCLVIVVKTH